MLWNMSAYLSNRDVLGDDTLTVSYVLVLQWSALRLQHARYVIMFGVTLH
jgi:hypothetical protein